MTQAATLSPIRVVRLLDAAPCYRFYWEGSSAVEGEKSYRLEIGVLLKECAERLLYISESDSAMLSRDQHDAVDELVEEIGEIFKLLNRKGNIRLIGEVSRTVPALERQDMVLYMLLERIWSRIDEMSCLQADSVGFLAEAASLRRDISDFVDAAEERNRLLGLGWESEFQIRRELLGEGRGGQV